MGAQRILLLLDLGVLLRDVTMDVANPKKMMNDKAQALAGIIGVRYKRVDGSGLESTYYTDIHHP
jgi:hypothetical protein